MSRLLSVAGTIAALLLPNVFAAAPAQASSSPTRTVAPSTGANTCQVTVPNGSPAPGEIPSPSHHGQKGLWTALWPDGTVVFRPGGPGFVLADGSLQMKFPWWRGVQAPLTIEGRRLDGVAPPLRAHIPSGYRPSGFQASGLIFPTPGCWEVTGRAGEATLTFVVNVVKIGEGPASAASQGRDISLCGRVVAVSCEGPSSGVRLLIKSPLEGPRWRVVIPPERRQLFGPRIEDRFDERLVCVASTHAAANSEHVVVRDPDDIVVTDAREPMPLPNEVARTCDTDVRLPTPVRTIYAHYTADAMRAKGQGSVMLKGIVDLNGNVRDVRVVQSSEPGMDMAAREAFAQWQFRPAMRQGQPVAMAISVEMTFTVR